MLKINLDENELEHRQHFNLDKVLPVQLQAARRLRVAETVAPGVEGVQGGLGLLRPGERE